jgi:hypothetical protein
VLVASRYGQRIAIRELLNAIPEQSVVAVNQLSQVSLARDPRTSNLVRIINCLPFESIRLRGTASNEYCIGYQ